MVPAPARDSARPLSEGHVPHTWPPVPWVSACDERSRTSGARHPVGRGAGGRSAAPRFVGLGLASNEVTTAIEDAKADPLDGEIPLRTTFTDASGAPIATFYDQNRVYVPLSSISDYLQVAVISMEDRRFYQHQGVDWRGTVRALLRNAQSTSNSPQGGSTLTQQYVKNYLYLVEAKTEAEKADAIATTPIRKLREAKMALSLEQTLSKAEILERYLNLVAFGPSQYGAEAASQWFFGVSADKLTLAQAALLAGMVNNPPKYNPLDENHVQDARDRRDLVLDVMVAAGRLSKATAEETKKQDLGLNPNRTRNGCIPADNSETNGFFCQYALDYLAAAGFDAKTVARSGWTIKTTLDPGRDGLGEGRRHAERGSRPCPASSGSPTPSRSSARTSRARCWRWPRTDPTGSTSPRARPCSG